MGLPPAEPLILLSSGELPGVLSHLFSVGIPTILQIFQEKVSQPK